MTTPDAWCPDCGRPIIEKCGNGQTCRLARLENDNKRLAERVAALEAIPSVASARSPALPKAEPARCYDCGSRELVVQCPECGKFVCAACVEKPYAFCCDNPAPESTPDVPVPVSVVPKGDGDGEAVTMDLDREYWREMARARLLTIEQLRDEVARLGALLDDSRAERKRLHHDTEVAANRVEELESDVAQLRAAGSAGGSGQGEEVRAGIVRYLRGVARQYEAGDMVEQDDFAAEAYGDAANCIEARRDVEAAAALAETNVTE